MHYIIAQQLIIDNNLSNLHKRRAQCLNFIENNTHLLISVEKPAFNNNICSIPTDSCVYVFSCVCRMVPGLMAHHCQML